MEQWIRLLRSDPDQGIRLLLKEHGGLLYYAVRSVLSGFSEDDVQECVSDTLLYIYRRREQLDFADSGWKTYLVKCARHIALDKLRKTERIPEPADDAIWDMTASDRNAEEEALAQVEREELIRRIVELGEPDATILFSKYFLSMQCKEIAEHIGMKENTVAQRAGRALKRLAKNWKGEETHA